MRAVDEASRNHIVRSRIARAMLLGVTATLLGALSAQSAGAAATVPPAVKMPGSQPGEAGKIESVSSVLPQQGML